MFARANRNEGGLGCRVPMPDGAISFYVDCVPESGCCQNDLSPTVTDLTKLPRPIGYQANMTFLKAPSYLARRDVEAVRVVTVMREHL